jgi:GntR family carbon starvation induced transcriptional regulator
MDWGCMSTLDDDPATPMMTEAAAAAARLRRDILSGALAPEIKLKVRELTVRYRISASPMREALSQLAASGFVVHHGQRGFRVPPITTENLVDITESRKIIEAEALRLAIRHANPIWEDEIVASYHLFERQVIRFYDGEDRRLDVYEDRHHRFHRALIAACPLGMLKTFCNDLYLRKTRYRAITRSYDFSKEVVIEEHCILKNAVLSRDEDAAVEAIKSHIGITAEVIQKLLPSGDKPIPIKLPGSVPESHIRGQAAAKKVRGRLARNGQFRKRVR